MALPPAKEGRARAATGKMTLIQGACLDRDASVRPAASIGFVENLPPHLIVRTFGPSRLGAEEDGQQADLTQLIIGKLGDGGGGIHGGSPFEGRLSREGDQRIGAKMPPDFSRQPGWTLSQKHNEKDGQMSVQLFGKSLISAD